MEGKGDNNLINNMNEITVNGNYKNNEISHEEVPNINMTHNTFEERLFEVIRSQIKETLKTMLPQHLQAIRNDIKILQDSVDTLRDEFTTIHPFQTASNIEETSSPNYTTQTLQSPYSLTNLDTNALEDQPLTTFTSRLRTIEDEKKFKDYCREAARLCLDLSKPWTSQKPSSRTQTKKTEKEATKLVVEHTGASEEEAQNRFKKYLTHIKSYQKKTKAAAERGINYDFIITGKRRHSESPPLDHPDDDNNPNNKRHCLDDLDKEEDHIDHLLNIHQDDDLNRLGN